MNRISKQPAWQCPSCGGDPTGLTWEDGETIGLAAPPSGDSRVGFGNGAPRAGDDPIP